MNEPFLALLTLCKKLEMSDSHNYCHHFHSANQNTFLFHPSKLLLGHGYPSFLAVAAQNSLAELTMDSRVHLK